MSNSSKFGVRPAPGSPGGMLQPKLPFRFRLAFAGFGTAGSDTSKLVQNVVSCTKPKISQTEVAVHSYNSTGYFGGKTKYETVSLVVRDDITNASISLIGQQLQKQFNHHEQTSAIAGSDYKFRMEIQSLDGTHGSPLEVWNLEGCWITNAEYGENKYEDSSEASLITLTIRFDLATHISGNNENVVTVGGDPFPNVGPVAGNLGKLLGGFGDITN